MKKILLSLLATLLVSITGTSQAQEYFADGYTFTYGVAKQDSLYSIVATEQKFSGLPPTADRFHFLSNQANPAQTLSNPSRHLTP